MFIDTLYIIGSRRNKALSSQLQVNEHIDLRAIVLYNNCKINARKLYTIQQLSNSYSISIRFRSTDVVVQISSDWFSHWGNTIAWSGGDTTIVDRYVNKLCICKRKP